jgi:hypothetical protein
MGGDFCGDVAVSGVCDLLDLQRALFKRITQIPIIILIYDKIKINNKTEIYQCYAVAH